MRRIKKNPLLGKDNFSFLLPFQKTTVVSQITTVFISPQNTAAFTSTQSIITKTTVFYFSPDNDGFHSASDNDEIFSSPDNNSSLHYYKQRLFFHFHQVIAIFCMSLDNVCSLISHQTTFLNISSQTTQTFIFTGCFFYYWQRRFLNCPQTTALLYFFLGNSSIFSKKKVSSYFRLDIDCFIFHSKQRQFFVFSTDYGCFLIPPKQLLFFLRQKYVCA